MRLKNRKALGVFLALLMVPQVAIPALGHTMGEWETVKYPTFCSTGLAQATCSRCDYVAEKTLDMLETPDPDDYLPDDYDDGIVCILCDTYNRYKDNPFIGPLISIIHVFIHFVAGITPSLRVW